MSKIVVIGSSNADLVVNTKKAPEGGETVMGESFAMNYGGKGANQAVAVQRIGGEVTFVAKVGDDQFGHQMRNHFAEEKMDLTYLYTDAETSSGVALIIVDGRAENRIVVAAGANGKLTEKDIEAALPAIEKSEIVLMQLETPMATVEYVCKKAAALNKKMILNPAPACQLSDDLLNGLFLITPNETEAGILTGVSVEDEVSVLKAADILLDKGVQNVAITLGAKGVWVHNAYHSLLIKSYKVDAVDTVAAGDVFNGAMAVALSEGKNLIEAAKFACAASAISVTRIGAQSSVPYREEVEEFMK